MGGDQQHPPESGGGGANYDNIPANLVHTPERRRKRLIKAQPIGSRAVDAKRYEKRIREAILDRYFLHFRTRIQRAGDSYEAIRQAIRALPRDPSLQSLSVSAARAHVAQMKEWHTRRFRRVMTRAFGVDVGPLMPDLGLEKLMRQAIARNVGLIVTIPPRFHADLVGDMERLAREAPFDRKAVNDVLAKKYKSSGYNLRRLTRDQTSKLNGEFNQARQEQVGVEAYEWSSVGDERVRESHRSNDGQIFRWDRPPVTTGHPGEDIQCRCIAIAVITPEHRQSVRHRVAAVESS